MRSCNPNGSPCHRRHDLCQRKLRTYRVKIASGATSRRVVQALRTGNFADLILVHCQMFLGFGRLPRVGNQARN